MPAAARLAGRCRYLVVPPRLAGVREAASAGRGAVRPVPLRIAATGNKSGRQRGRFMVGPRCARAKKRWRSCWPRYCRSRRAAPTSKAMAAQRQRCGRSRPARAANRFVLRTDVKSYYASIDHLLLMDRLARWVGERSILKPPRPVTAPHRREWRLVLGYRARHFARLPVEPADRGLLFG
jgi:hypothetical protein